MSEKEFWDCTPRKLFALWEEYKTLEDWRAVRNELIAKGKNPDETLEGKKVQQEVSNADWSRYFG